MLDNLRDLLRGSQQGTTAAVRQLNSATSGGRKAGQVMNLLKNAGKATGGFLLGRDDGSGTLLLNAMLLADGLREGGLSAPNKKEKGFADLRGSITPGSMQPAATNLGEGAAMDAAERFRAGAGFPEGVIRPDDYPTLLKLPENNDGGSGDSQLNDRGPSAADLLQKFNGDTKKAEDEGMRIWAEKFGTLAKQVKEGQAGYEVIQDTLYPKTEEGFANPDKPVVEMIDGQKLQEPMSINQLNAVLDVRDFNMKPTSVMSVLAQKDPQKALNEFMTANGLVAK